MGPTEQQLELEDDAGRTVSALDSLDETSRQWLADLDATSDRHDTAVAELHALLRRVARAEASRRAGTHGIRGVELYDLAEQAANDACVSVLRRLPDFEGRSRFTTWASKFAILGVAQKIGRHRWSRVGVVLDPDDWNRLPESLATDPTEVTAARELIDAIHDVVRTELTERQRHIFEALFISRVGFDVLAIELGTNRNALYKAEFDIRAKLRRHLVARGHIKEEETWR
ncbi:sigma-70 family RNA polymerase sigma factor [Kribbella sp. NPDC051137]|uniref:sigma-70 family RNA polymerase sigma factor n=1 Tax=Kribbella sp. NPDC051137 TaxID=3155045 RepID=UPI003434BEDB